MRHLLVILSKGFVYLFLFGSLFTSILYCNTTIFIFPEISPFQGEKLYNPYQNIYPTFLRANFHAHTKSWGGITSGKNSERELYQAYAKKGYDLIGISNYHKIYQQSDSSSKLFLPFYEHGYNIGKSHILVGNASTVSFFDYPLLQSIHHQQDIINRLKKHGEFLVMAHPKFGGGRRLSSVSSIVGYRFMEVISRTLHSDFYWDSVLSAGKLVWGLGNDDTHDLVKQPPFRCWTMINAPNNLKAVQEALSKGSFYAAYNKRGKEALFLISCNVQDDDIQIRLNHQADSIVFFGQSGHRAAIVSFSDSARYRFQHDDTV